MALETILVVDDEETISSYLQRKLTKLGYSVAVAEDGEKALELAFSTLPDVILMDVKLPKLTGTEACRRLKADPRTAAIPILLLSAKAQPAEIREGLDAGADRYLCKPISFPDILAHLRAFDNL